jgi:hypothetical protein
MHKLFTSSFDASIYLQQPEQNAGRDEILEVAKLYYGATKDIHRALIKFDTGSIKSDIVSIGTGSWNAYLNLKSSQAQEIPLEYIIHANAVSQSWDMGVGTKFDNITSNGVSWYYKNGIDKWITDFPTYEDYSTGSQGHISGSLPSISNGGGGTWYTASMASQSYSYEDADIRMNVTGIVNKWISGSIPNNGFIIHHTLENEVNELDYGVLKFFSKETNTIYEPKLELVWDDSSFATGSLLPVTGSAQDDYKVIITNLKREYSKDSKIKIRVKGRDIFPLKSFSTTFEYDQSKYLPTTSYYQLEDYITDDIIYPFGEYTKISCDSTSNYFIIDLSTLPLYRTYRLKFKIESSGISTIIDEKLTFQIV